MHRPFRNRVLAAGMIAGAGLLATSVARADLAEDFNKKIRPIMERKCFECHDADVQKGDLNLARFASFDAVTSEPETWQHVLERVQAAEMPPKKKGKLDYGDLQSMMDWLRKLPKPEGVDCTKLASDRTASYYRGYVMSRRLNRDEYVNSVRDLFGAEFELPFSDLLPKDGGGGEGFDTAGDALFLSSIHIERYLDAADRVVMTVLPENRRAMSPEMKAARERLLVETPGIFTRSDTAAREVIAPLARKAWRRPVTDEEVDRLLTMFQRARDRGDSFEESLRLALKAVLISPHFLFL
ncbi:MAG TPA: hypothetical protein DCY13_00555, partial [Verrucomicrobiales bacterium]|nr:hypothetical protein [Verrucomicrobiales bacterium]